MKYESGEFLIISDFEIRTLREGIDDIDLFIPMNMRTLNLYIEDLPAYIKGRLQFTQIRNLIIRFSMNQEEKLCTIHLLKDIDLQSAEVNFKMKYKDYYIILRENKYFNEMYLKKK